MLVLASLVVVAVVEACFKRTEKQTRGGFFQVHRQIFTYFSPKVRVCYTHSRSYDRTPAPRPSLRKCLAIYKDLNSYKTKETAVHAASASASNTYYNAPCTAKEAAATRCAASCHHTQPTNA